MIYPDNQEKQCDETLGAFDAQLEKVVTTYNELVASACSIDHWTDLGLSKDEAKSVASRARTVLRFARERKLRVK